MLIARGCVIFMTSEFDWFQATKIRTYLKVRRWTLILKDSRIDLF